MTALTCRSVLVLVALAIVLGDGDCSRVVSAQESPALGVQVPRKEAAMLVQYLEVVTADVDATCSVLEKLHEVRFGEPDARLGNARTATLKGGGRIGVRAPLREDEDPVVRPYVLVNDIEAAVKAAEEAGGEIAMYPTEIPGRGKFAIYFLGGIQYGLWEL